MGYTELAKLIKEVGISVGVFILCFWIVQFIVKRMASSLDSLTLMMKTFTDRVRDEHKSHSAEHQKIIEIAEETVKTLGRINGYKE